MDQNSVTAAPKKHILKKEIPDRWTADEKTKVTELYAAGKSMGVIADCFPNRSRNSIAGIIHRMRKKKLTKAKNAIPSTPKKHKWKYTPPHLRANAVAQKTIQDTSLLLKLDPVSIRFTDKFKSKKQKRVRLRLIENPTAVTMQDLDRHHCRWPQGDPKRSDFRFCGCKRLDGSPYCVEHTITAGRKYTENLS